MTKFERQFFYANCKELSKELLVKFNELDNNLLDNIEQKGLKGYYDSIKDEEPLKQLATYVKTMIDYIQDYNIDAERWYKDIK
jgi:hypothetical protein